MKQSSIPMSQWEWEGIVNDPRHQAEADARAAERAQLQQSREAILEEQRQQEARNKLRQMDVRQKRHRNHMQVQAMRFAVLALGLGALGYFLFRCGEEVVGYIVESVALICGSISLFGYGRVSEWDKGQ